jgi:DNA-binding NarL/FixJ family response regulator
MLQEPVTFGAEIDARHVLAAVGLVVGDGHRELPPQIASTGIETLIAPVASVTCVSRAQPDFELIEALSAREIQVLKEIAKGKANKEIATTLEISENTVKDHLKSILNKLHVAVRTEAVTAAVQRGIIEL